MKSSAQIQFNEYHRLEIEHKKKYTKAEICTLNWFFDDFLWILPFNEIVNAIRENNSIDGIAEMFQTNPHKNLEPVVIAERMVKFVEYAEKQKLWNKKLPRSEKTRKEIEKLFTMN